jgi:cytochrome c biogenesis protein CcdA
MLRKIKIIILLVFLLVGNLNITVRANEKKLLIYFYSSTCSSCSVINSYLNTIQQNEVKIIKYNILENDNKGLLNTYCKKYGVNDNEYGIVPIIFISNKYLFGESSIKDNLIKCLDDYKDETVLLKNIDYSPDIKTYQSMNIGTVFIAGVINGINPCTLSMLIFLLTLLSTKKSKVTYSLAFIAGKFITFLILGLFCYTILKNIDFTFINIITKYFLTIVCLVLIVLNIFDIISISKNKYEKIKLKLPNKLISINQKVIKKINNYNSLYYISIFSFLIGILVTLGEFLCSGQIYLSTIIALIKFQTYRYYSILYLIIFDIGYIIPLLICTFIIYKSKSSTSFILWLNRKLLYIKLLNVIFFIVILIIYII